MTEQTEEDMDGIELVALETLLISSILWTDQLL